MAKQMAFDAEAREALRSGVRKLSRAMRVTLGPKGQNIIIDRSWGGPSITKDGSTVAEEIDLKDPNENMGARLIREAAKKTSDESGDGTTTSTLLASTIFEEGLKHVAGGTDQTGLSRAIQRATAEVIGELRSNARDIELTEVERIGTIAANGDRSMGGLLAEAFDKVGKDGVITVEESKTSETQVVVVEGMQFDRGFLSPHFVTDGDRLECVLEKAYILLSEEKVASIQELVPLLEKVSASRRPLLIVAEDVEGDALRTMVVNRIRGTISCCAVKAPGYGDRRKAMLQDLAVLTGGKVFSSSLGRDLESLELSDLGQADRIVIDNNNTTIRGGSGDEAALQARAEQIRADIENTTSDYDREKLQERLAKLVGGIAEIRVGAVTEIALKERKSRLEDALSATRAALEEGIVPGGGVALYRAAEKLDVGSRVGADKAGYQVVQRALQAPMRQIATNAGLDGSAVVSRVRRGEYSFGFDAELMEYCDLYESGVVDPVKVVRTALQNAASVGALLLTTNAIVSDIPKKDEDED